MIDLTPLERRITRLERTARRLTRYEPALDQLGAEMGLYLGLPGLVGLWPLNNYDASGNVYDLSGQARTLTKNGTVVPTVQEPALLYQDFQGGYFQRADEADLSITGNLTVGGWFWIDALDATPRGAIGKSNSTGNQRSYTLFQTTTDVLRFQVSSDGTATTLIDSATPPVAQWLFAVGRYQASTRLDLFVGSGPTLRVTTNTTSIPAAIFDSTAPFEIGAVNNGANVWDGRARMCFLCRARLRDDHINHLFQRGRALVGI